jgi:SAM-dependent methyltransferase
MTNLSRKLQKWLKPLEHTPLHPQWLVLRHRDDTYSWVAQHAQGTLIDIGCGNGHLRDHIPHNTHYIGIDYPTTIALGYTGRPDVHADASELPIATEKSDTVTLLDVLEHLPSPEQAIAEASRILRDGGKLLIHVPFIYPLHDEPHDYQRWTRHGLKQLLEQHDLVIHEINETLSAIETASSLMTIALSKALVDSIDRRSPSLLITPLFIVLIPTINLMGRVLGLLLPSSQLLPFSYRVMATRKHRNMTNNNDQRPSAPTTPGIV